MPRATLSLVLPLAALAACAELGKVDLGEAGDSQGGLEIDDPADPDGDGSPVGEDCDDTDGSVFPGAPEACDGLDQDCDGVADDNPVDAPVWHGDADGDGWGADRSVVSGCEAPAGMVPLGGDCDDADPAVNPGAAEACDGADNDCDTAVDEDGAISSDDGSAWTDLQAAIDAAPAGAVLTVCPATWSGPLRVERSLTLRGAGADVTIVDAQGGGPALTVAGGDVVVDGIAFTGGTGASWEGDTTGGGVAAMDAGSLELVDCVVEGNAAAKGAGIAGPTSGALVMRGGRVEGNVASGGGGGLYLWGGALEDVDVAGNEADQGAGLYVVGGGAATTTDARFASNAASRGGHVYAADGATFTATDTAFEGGTAQWGGALLLYGATFVGTRVDLRANVADQGGGAYLYMDAVATLVDSTVESNEADAGGGARLKTTAALASVNTGWGEGASDNGVDDVDVANESFGYGAAATFACDTETSGCL